ncbi:Prolipoprotein diacylglyceryl transferase [Candidatus Erwinia haradaeae]|uniref:Phosphatidylglycerol--prolipoprotein diacylglyceryl transferase n=1 Tax=Candidatus Erwinia haradaeae TaxID=1922217 RepID=A0A451DBW5_9GAMM|nr:prolipoprotein diacylglyceryl transferase [Candidatus Erwinia haradaeae]VFP83902.1 Prolipoprotein diacylglyceryl transferase [Candidatus Erwinia haradaeae]
MHHAYLVFPQFDPVIASIGPVSLHWYGLMYVISFILVRWIARRRVHKYGGIWNKDAVDDLIYSGFLGVVFGGRLGYALFYNFPVFLHNPLYVFHVWKGGMSFHGGFIGVIIALWIFSHRTQRNFFVISDFIAPLIPLGLGAGRLGNYINGELWGRVDPNLPWAMLFPNSYSEDIKLAANDPEWQQMIVTYGVLPRHPSQLYEAFLEGFVLFIVLHFFIFHRPRPVGAVSALFLILYSVFRIFVEFFRQPDQQIGLFYGISMGQILSVPMCIAGIILMLVVYNQRTPVTKGE